MKKMLGDDAPDFSRGEKEFMWTMANAVQNQSWNNWGPHGDGISWKDHQRLTRILRLVYKDILEDEAQDDDNDDDEEVDFDETEAGENMREEGGDADFFLI
jgi:hypothetical protein